MTQLESKLGEVMGLAQAAQDATAKVIKMVDDDEVAGLLRRMREEAAETEKRCRAVAGERKGKKSAIQEKARETKSEAVEMMNTYLGKVRELVQWVEPIQKRHVKDTRTGSLKLAAQEDPDETE